MTLMSATVSHFPPAGSGPLTVRDLEGLPDDGRRYELLDGTLVMRPAPGRRHQKIALRLGALLEQVCPPELDVMTAPFAVHCGERIELQPDVLVAREQDFTETDLPVPPTLAVEILSPSTALHDANTKKALYERLGVASYWIIDPDQPSMQVFELNAEGAYRQVAKVAGEEPLDATKPFRVRVLPNDLLGRLAS